MNKKAFAYLLVAPTIIIITLMLLYPIALNISYGFRDVSPFSGASKEFIGLKNYIDVFNQTAFKVALKNTIIFTVASVVIQFLIGLPLAILYNQNLPGQGIARGLALVPWMIPHVVAALTWVWMLDGSLGIINEILVKLNIIDNYKYWLSDVKFALAAVTLINVWKGIPFNIMVLLAGLQTMPHELYEAASMDGASVWQRFTNITLPLLRPQISVLFILGTIWTFRNFDLIFITTGGGPVHATEILSTLAYKYSFEFFQMGRGAAVSNIMFVILMIFTLVYAYFLEKDTRFE